MEGHVDCTGKIVSRSCENDSIWLRIAAAEPSILRYIVTKGYIAIDGISLTVCDVDEVSFTIMMVAYTQEKVVLSSKKEGDLVNLEVDILAKYADKLLQNHDKDVVTPRIVEEVRQHVEHAFNTRHRDGDGDGDGERR